MNLLNEGTSHVGNLASQLVSVHSWFSESLQIYLNIRLKWEKLKLEYGEE